MDENHLEAVCLDWLIGLGWTCMHSDALSPGGELPPRDHYVEVEAGLLDVRDCWTSGIA